MCRSAYSSTNKCGIDHVDLSLYKQTPLFIEGEQSMLVRPLYRMREGVFMLKIVFPICCGIDVHKTFVVATIASTDRENITTYQTKRFSTFTKNLRALSLWLSNNQCMSAWNPLASTGFLSHPKYVKAIRGKKTDKKDSVWIADLHKNGLVPGSFIPPADIREIRDLLRYTRELLSPLLE